MGRTHVLRSLVGLAVIVVLLHFLLCRCPRAADLGGGTAVAATEPPAGAEQPSPAEQGRRLFKKLTCNSCHMIAGWGGQNAPDLTEVTTKYIKIKGSLKAAQEFYLNHIMDPDKYPGVDKAKYPFVRMPQIKTTEEQRQLLIEYLTTLRKKE